MEFDHSFRFEADKGEGLDVARQDGERVNQFSLGQDDIPDRLLIPDKLYGRAREVETLLATFDRMVNGGKSELVLVSGYSGVGKSSVVNELHKVLVPPRGLFAFGKFDQYKRDIPYSTLVQAFQSLVRPLLGTSNRELAIWRGALLEALDPNALLMTDLIPELKLIIGEPAPIPELEPQQAKSRFQLVFQRFIGVFARPEHPLALFLDDLQWLDAATLDLVEDLLTRSDLQHVMLIGAYRNNEVDAAHPLARKLDAFRGSGARVQEIHLAPLTHDDLAQLISDAFRRDPSDMKPLAQLVHDKTAGNPFFALQFLHTLDEQGLLRFDHDTRCWSWDVLGIQTKAYTDNVVDLMIGKLARLPAHTQHTLQQLACLGNTASAALLSTVVRAPEEQVHMSLWPAVRQEFVERLEGGYRFIHDRVQEAAYSLIPEALRAEVHLRIGRLLMSETPAEKREEAIFEIVGQLNHGAVLIAEQDERDQLAECNLIAGRRAKGSTAYASALAYLNTGAALLSVDSWEQRHELVFALELNRAECEFLTGQLLLADERLIALSSRATTATEQAAVACLHMDVCTALDQSARAVEVCLKYLRHVGIEWSAHPNEEEVRREYDRIWSLLGGRTIEELFDLPLMEDRVSLATVDVLTKVSAPATFTDANLYSVTQCRAISVSLERGHCDASCIAYVHFGSIAGPRFANYKDGFRFGQLGYDLVARRGLKRFEARTYLGFAIFVVRWIKHVRACRELLLSAFETANRIGDLTIAAYACNNMNSDLLFAGEPLAEVEAEVKDRLAFAVKARFGLVIDRIATQLALIRMLRGLTNTFGSFDDPQFNELRFESNLSSSRALAVTACRYWIRKLQARYMAGDYATAMDALLKAQPLLWTSPWSFEAAEYHFYGALARAANCDSEPVSERQQHLDALAEHHTQLQIWTENCPENFENRAALVGAEIARLQGRDTDAMHLYEQAIRSARASGFAHNEALADELASRFYQTRGFEDIAHLYLSKARYGYLRWGADGKVRQLDALYPRLQKEEPAPAPAGTIGARIEHLDLTTVIKVSQAVSSAIVLEQLVDTLMRTAIEQAGAERGVLILSLGPEQRIAAEATTSGETIVVRLRDDSVAATELPQTILNYVQRTRDSAILDDATDQSPFSADPYVRQHHTRSIVCLPLINQAKLIGVLYLENNLTACAFAPNRIAVLKLLASQAAISLENARLYRDLIEREGNIQRLVEAAHRSEKELRNVIEAIPAMAWTALPEGSNEFANRRWAEYTGLSAQDTAGSGWQVAVHPGDVEQYVRNWHASLAAGEPFEDEARFRCAADGEYRWFLVRGVPLRDDRGVILRWYGIHTDIEDRKRAEALLAGEKRILEMVAKGESLPRILDCLCLLVEEHARDALTAILLVEDGRLRHVAKPNLPPAYVEAVEGKIAVGPKVGSCGPAAYFARQVIISDITTDPSFDELRDVVPLFPSLRAVWSTPIMSSERKVIGTFAMYYREPRSPSPRDQEIIEQITHLAGVAIQRAYLDRDLAEREARIRRLCESNIIGIFIWDFEGQILEANDAFLRIVGHDRQDLVAGRLRWTDLVPPEWYERDGQPWIPELKRNGVLPPFEKEYFRKDGSRVPVLMGSATFYDTGNQGVAFVLDLTERKRSEQALRESEEKWRAVFENNPSMYFIVDAEGKILSVNGFGAEQLGYTPEELIDAPVENLFHNADREIVRKNAAACLENIGKAITWEVNKVRKDGSTLWVRETARAMLMTGRPVVLIMCEDITERKRAEHLTGQVFESYPDAICVIGRDYRIQRVNSFYERTVGVPAEKLIGAHAADVLGTTFFEHTLKPNYDRCVAGDEITYSDWFNYHTSRRYLSVSYVPLRPVSDCVEAILISTRDLTDHVLASEALRSAQAELAHANRVATMGQLTASIAHEVNQPITASVTHALGALRWLNAQPPNIEEAAGALARIVKEGNRASDVIGRIRALIRKAPPRKDAVAINDAIMEVMALTSTEATNNAVSVRTLLAEDLPLVQGDRVQIQQVILNLVLNAIEAMRDISEAERELLISAAKESDGVLVEVRDSGPGLPPATMERLFEPFYTTKPTGLGLGLSICQSIVEANGGRLWAGANVPRGSVFRFTIRNQSESAA